jgi:hypothetical protein
VTFIERITFTDGSVGDLWPAYILGKLRSIPLRLDNRQYHQQTSKRGKQVGLTHPWRSLSYIPAWMQEETLNNGTHHGFSSSHLFGPSDHDHYKKTTSNMVRFLSNSPIWAVKRLNLCIAEFKTSQGMNLYKSLSISSRLKLRRQKMIWFCL